MTRDDGRPRARRRPRAPPAGPAGAHPGAGRGAAGGEKRVPLATARALVPGSLLTFEKGCEDPLELYVANRPHAVGEAVKVGERFGLKVTAVRGA